MKVPPTNRTAAAIGNDPWWIYGARVIRRRDEVEGVITLDVTLTDEQVRREYRFRPGQFNMLYVHGVGECPISISSDPSDPTVLGHTIRLVGQVTNALPRDGVDSAIGLRGPFGSWWPLEETRGKNLILVAGGIGLPPLRGVLYHVMRHRSDYKRVVLVYGVKTVSDLLFASEYLQWREAGIEVFVTVDRADEKWKGERGLVPTLLKKIRLRGRENAVMTCGPEIMMKYVVHECLDRGIPEDQVYISMERNMECACTFCGHCQLGPEFVCKDGPVFAYDRIKRYFMQDGF